MVYLGNKYGFCKDIEWDGVWYIWKIEGNVRKINIGKKKKFKLFEIML